MQGFWSVVGDCAESNAVEPSNARRERIAAPAPVELEGTHPLG